MAKARKNNPRRDVPSQDHVARYCNPQRVKRDPKTRTIIGVFPQAFELRPQMTPPEEYLSTYWMEAFSRELSDQYRGALAALKRKRGLAPLGVFARLNVGAILTAGMQRSLPIRVRDRSSPSDPGYSGIYNMPLDNRDVEFLALLAEECCIDACIVREIEATQDLLSPYPLQSNS
ncbi:MAG TPA: hypothetical protein VN715_16465 [Roseiarcus sp.]|nr:hypothetical protein [Roseiarcus sp.]